MRSFPRPRLLFDCPPEVLGRAFLITARGSFTLEDCRLSAERAARVLAEAGVRPSERVAILAAGAPEVVVLFLALWRARAVAVPVSPRWPPRQIEAHLRAIGCPLLVWDGVHGEPSRSVRTLPLGEVVTLDAPAAHPNRRIDSPPLIPGPWPRDATVIFTSGSEGLHKAVLHSFGAHYANAAGANARLPFGCGDAWLLALPLDRVGGLAPIFRALAGGGAVACGPAGTQLDALIEMFAATHLSLVPTQLLRLCANPPAAARLAAMKAVLVGGGAVPPALLAEARARGIPALATYGSTEMASQIATADPSAPDRPRVLPYRRLAIAPDGEILVRGLPLCRGYVRGARVAPVRAPDGWFATGDLGAVDADGRCTIAGRKDAMFISGGENVHPQEIEQALMEAPGVARALVVPLADPEFGHRPVAFIAAERLDESALREFLAPRLARWKIPRRFLPWPVDAGPGDDKAARAEFARRAAAILACEDAGRA